LNPHPDPNLTESERQRRFRKRVMAERAEEARISRITKARSMNERIRDYIDTKYIEDHITFAILVGIFHKGALSIPKDDAERFRFNAERDKISGTIGKVIDETGSVSIGRILHEDDTNPIDDQARAKLGEDVIAHDPTHDVEHVLFNARKEKQLDEQRRKAGTYMATMKRRVEKRVEIVRKPARERRKIIREEQAANSGN